MCIFVIHVPRGRYLRISVLSSMKAFLSKPKFFSLLTNGFASGISLLSFSFLARLFTAEELAYWTLFLSLSTLYSMINHGFIAEVFIRKWGLTKSQDDQIDLIGSAWQIMISISLLCISIICLYFVFFYSGNGVFESNSIPFPLLIVIFILVDSPSSVSYWKFQSELRFQKILLFKSSEQALFFLAVLVVSLLGDHRIDESNGNLTSIIIIYLGIKMLTSLTLILLNQTGIQFVLRGTNKSRKEIVSFGKYAVGTQAVSSIASDSDFYLIMKMKGAGASADYAVAQKCMPIIGLPINAIAQVSYPKLVKAHAQGRLEFNKMLHQELGLLCVLVWPACLFVLINAEWIIQLIGGQEFAGSASILEAMVFFTFLMPLDKIIGLTLNVHNLPSLNFTKLLVSVAVNVIGDLVVLMISDNLAYVAYISVLSAISGVFVGYVALRKEQKINLMYALRLGIMKIMGRGEE